MNTNANLIDITKPVQTKDGRKVTQLTKFDINGGAYPIVGVIEGDNTTNCWSLTGQYHVITPVSIRDIVNVKEKTIVPLTSADIKPTDIFRRNHTEVGFHTIGCLSENLIAINGMQGSFSFPFLRENFLISRNGGTTWERCEKEVEE